MIHFILFSIFSFGFTYALLRYTNYMKVLMLLFMLVVIYAVVFDRMDNVFTTNLSTGAYIGTVIGAMFGAMIGFDHRESGNDIIKDFLKKE